MSKLTKDQVIAIRKDCEAGMSYSQIARKHGIGRSQAGRIARRESWRHI